MYTFTVFPNLKVKGNPYIQDFIDALNRQEGIKVVNPAHKNPLLSILPPKHWGNAFIFNWFESIPDFKYGLLQSFIAIVFLTIIKLSGRKIIWILHNKQPHVQRYGILKRFLAKLIAKNADLIITHAKDGIELIREKHPYAIHKVHFLHHPTKNRLDYSKQHSPEKIYDILIWGAIAQYKGVTEFIDFLCKHPEEKLNVCIIGKCASTELYDELTRTLPANVTLIHERASFEKLAEYINRSHFVLMPYFSRSILSSGILMDSLSFGAKIIGPHTGSFKDYSHEPLLHVHTFKEFCDIYPIVNKTKGTPVSLENYQKFLEENNWEAFATSLIHLSNINHHA
jgi:glycosyltransferase involved in cell wall biosynthesis